MGFMVGVDKLLYTKKVDVIQKQQNKTTKSTMIREYLSTWWLYYNLLLYTLELYNTLSHGLFSMLFNYYKYRYTTNM